MRRYTSLNGLGGALRRCVGTRARRWLVAGILLLGAAAAAALGAAVAPPDRTFAVLSDPVQSLMSVLVPLLGILLVRDLRGAPGEARLAPTLSAAVLVAAAFGAFGAAACAVALAVAPADAAQDPWAHAGVVAVGGVLVQVVAQLIGTGLGLLLRSAPVAFLATFLPLALWLGLGAVDALRPAQDWLTPYEAARHLLSGVMGTVAWLQWLTVVLIWVVGLNAAGAARTRR
ncbi:hypothetical protein AB0K00_25320 [Dactylosporangium sp. NPDC049525]|uniref:hypothetical protein n=1 Tax=Dactylosporangium sp. NPDC049525 TaxID=3154730 RepID=UPI003425CB75